MSQISLKSISGITSITTPAGVDNVFTVHTNDTTEKFRVDQTGNQNISGIVTATNFKTGSSNLHSAGVEVAGVNVQGGDTPVGLGATIYNSGAAVFTGVVTATSYYGDGSNLTGIAADKIFEGNTEVETVDTGSNGHIKFTTEGSERLRIDSSGRLGLNQSTPGSNLHMSAAGSNTITIQLTNATTGHTAGTDGMTMGYSTNSTAGFINVCEGGSDFTIKTGGTGAANERLRIKSDGKVGINSLAPAHKLDVDGIIRGSSYFQAGGNSTASHNFHFGAEGNGEFRIYSGNYGAGDEKLRIDSNGNLILGTSSWSYPKALNVQGSSGSILALSNYDTTSYAANTNTSIEFRINTGNTGQQNGACEIRAFKENGTNGNNARGLSFWTGANGASPSEKLRISSDGDVCVNNQAYNTYDTAGTNINTMVDNNEKRPGVYWINFGGKIFRAYIKPNWLGDRNWILAAKFFDMQDMPSGSSLWTNDTWVNESDFNLVGGIFSKYPAWRYFPFDRLAMQMGNRIPPIMTFSGNQTLYGAFSGGRASNGGGVTASGSIPSMSTGVTYHTMDNFAGPDFYDVGGGEDKIQSYGLNKWANNAANSTSAQNRGSENVYVGDRINPGGAQSPDNPLQSESLKGWGLTVEDSHPTINYIDSIGYAGAWIGCPLDESDSNPFSNTSAVGADSGWGMGFGCGNPGRTGTAGYAEWGRGTECVNTLPAYIWLSAD